ncbi:hypothetical protein Scep_009711 [Stephania cephalantha]|uniref:Uncharacterized protein n=1 Tax=Stephania cephalantha TaxID=152367 RepID=A0AAP0JUQ0_9MAGN
MDALLVNWQWHGSCHQGDDVVPIPGIATRDGSATGLICDLLTVLGRLIAAGPPPPPLQLPPLPPLSAPALHRLLSSRRPSTLLSSRLHCLLSSCRPSTASSQAVVSPPPPLQPPSLSIRLFIRLFSRLSLSLQPPLSPPVSPAAISLHRSVSPTAQSRLSLQPSCLSSLSAITSPVPPSAFVTSLTARCSTKIKNLDDNIGSVRVKLSEKDIKEISEAVPINEVAGDRTFQSWPSCSWKSADAPPKASHE